MTEPLATAAKSPSASAVANGRTSRRRFLPRFGLRALFVFAILFCLFFAFIGRNYVRMRREDAAIEALKQAGAVLMLKAGDGMARHPATPALANAPAPPNRPGGGSRITVEEDWYGRLFGYAERLAIRHINLQGEDPEDEKQIAALQALVALPEVESVNLRGKAFGDEALMPLASVAGLEAVGLYETEVTRAGLASLGPPTKLRKITLNPSASPELAAGLAALTELRSVSLNGLPPGGPATTRADLEAVAALPQLEELDLMYFRAPKRGSFESLSRAKNLRTLQIFGIALAKEDVAAVARIPRLETLRIGQFSDADLAKLGSIPSLRSIDISGPATSSGAVAFSKANPECLVGFATYSSEPRWYRGGEEVDPPAEDARGR